MIELSFSLIVDNHTAVTLCCLVVQQYNSTHTVKLLLKLYKHDPYKHIENFNGVVSSAIS